jgi:osmotically-inducible protein OsmY
VNLLGSDVRGDDEIRGIALQILVWDGDVPAENVNVKVSEGWVTLSGDVAYQFQSDAAYDDVASLYGVVGVTNEIKVNTP